ncbi:MAG: hypothetical protein AB1898_32780 [Acidobacteriota bacterium]
MKDHLWLSHQAGLDRRIRTAYRIKGQGDAKAELDRVVRYLERLNPSAALSLEKILTCTAWAFRISIAPA